MRTIILATVAAAALSMPALAQQPNPHEQSSQTIQQRQSAISPSQLSTSQVREVQQALDKMGFKAGAADGRWGPESRNALVDFQKSKNMPANGELDSMTISALGLKPSDFGISTGASTTGQAPNTRNAPGEQNGGRNVPQRSNETGGGQNNNH